MDGKHYRHGWDCNAEDQHPGADTTCDCGLETLLADKALLEELLGYLELPMRAALRQARPSASLPPNVVVEWRTGSDTVARMIERRNRSQEGK